MEEKKVFVIEEQVKDGLIKYMENIPYKYSASVIDVLLRLKPLETKEIKKKENK
ncbi:MAG: hypothetical protein U9O94_09815 [Nanoarchaeota archaeon]|nr:hypothetical protein [Nanoarchaeota archaeon]